MCACTKILKTLLLLKHGRCGYVVKTGVSKAEYLVYSMHTNRLSACREFCGVHIVGKMAQDVGMV